MTGACNRSQAERFEEFLCGDPVFTEAYQPLDIGGKVGDIRGRFRELSNKNRDGEAIRAVPAHRCLYVTGRWLTLEDIRARLTAAALEPAMIVFNGREYEVYWNTAAHVLADENFFWCQWAIARGVLSNGEKETGMPDDHVFIPGFWSYDSKEPFQVEIVYENADAPALTFAQIKQRGASEEDRKQHTDDQLFKLQPLGDREPFTIGRLTTLCNEWIWVVGLERFIRRRDPGKMWKVSQFDSQYNYMLDKGASISKHLFKMAVPLVRFERMVYAPGRDECLSVREYNSYRRPPISPRPGDTTLWNNHLLYLFPKGVADAEREALLNWMAWVLQNPSEKPHQALLIVGRQTGTGKSYLSRMLEAMIGVVNTQRPKNSSLGGDFNAWVCSCKLCVIEELMQIGRKEISNALREVITEPRIEVNIKGISAYMIDNYIATMATSNHPDALPIEPEDRRWLVLGVSNAIKAKPKEYYDRLFAETLDDPDAVAAIYYELLHRDLKGWEPRGHAMMTEAKREMVLLSRTDLESWLDDERENSPLCWSFVNIRDDIVSLVPDHIKRSEGRGLEKSIAKWLRANLDGERIGDVRVRGRVIKLWAINGAGSKVKASGGNADVLGDIAAIYSRLQRASAKLSAAEARQDFGEGDGDE